MAKAKASPGKAAGFILIQQVHTMAHNIAWAAMSTVYGVRNVQVDTRSRNRHVFTVTTEDGTVRSFTVQVIEHK